ncbi:hypothetical protein M4951_01195 [Blastopirellula sp. J2-11]|uniref:hypothetical protein n=1 Tax=Blastopirellula sp. J2-11 TaxID=2943192 RepID=UPI0021C5977E|nr:hypothetical protein [Blastopirellula sp. J2-11]UUO06941.1 hypothetical protein M4951_01195 [Blastopirellula sp. J2-11]
MECRKCGCRGGQTLDARYATFRGVRIVIRKIACRACGAVYSLQKKTKPGEDRDEYAPAPDHENDRREADEDESDRFNPFL